MGKKEDQEQAFLDVRLLIFGDGMARMARKISPGNTRMAVEALILTAIKVMMEDEKLSLRDAYESLDAITTALMERTKEV